MRLIGHLESEASARTFGDFLFVQGVENQIEFIQGEGWGIWINEEEQIAGASRLLSSFRENPDDPKYHADVHSLQRSAYFFQHALAARSRQHDRRAPEFLASGDSDAGCCCWFEPRAILRNAIRDLRRHVRRGLWAAWICLDSWETRSGI